MKLITLANKTFPNVNKPLLDMNAQLIPKTFGPASIGVSIGFRNFEDFLLDLFKTGELLFNPSSCSTSVSDISLQKEINDVQIKYK